MALSLILFSGLPGTGKTTLAREVARALGIPLLAKDRMQSSLRKRGLAERATADGYYLLFDVADEQLGLGVSVVLDAVFPLAEFREEASRVAHHHGARLCPTYCFCSDEAEWKKRLKKRHHGYVPYWSPVGWEEVERLREVFTPWERDIALFVDAVNNLESNLARASAWIEVE